jgi:DNA (cytosine-5)-methyltransferase 1
MMWVDGGALRGEYSMLSFGGVPQRRRRIALVADFGGLTAPEILFERKGVSGDSQPGGAPWKAFTTTAEGCVAETGCGGAVALRMRSGCDGGGKGALIQYEKSGTLGCHNDQTIICLSDQGSTLLTQEHRQQPIVVQALFENHTQIGRHTGPLEVAPTVAQKFGMGGNNTPLVVGFKYHQGAGARGLGEEEGISPALCADGGHPPAVATFQNTGIGWWNESNIGATLRTPCGGDSMKANLVLVAAVDCRNGTENPETNGTLQAKSSGGTSLNLNNIVREGTLVRRLTPLECERLQGFPDGWTDIGPWTDSKGKIHKESSDAARYRALGNSIALPSWVWVLARLSLCAATEPTMASLFDGIGGFPLIWEWLNGKGTCLWASEIEEFPIAVTKQHFSEEDTTDENYIPQF